MNSFPNLTQRPYSREIALTLNKQGMPTVLARIFAARGIQDVTQLSYDLASLARFDTLKNIQEMARILADAVSEKIPIVVIADYDADGATACAVALRSLRAFGAVVDYLVPNRFEYGYGLSPEIVEVAAAAGAKIIITVDNGIASVEGVAKANELGLTVLITDHHLPGASLPAAHCIVNPNQEGCAFPSKNLAGVGVIFYVMLALRAELRRRGACIDNFKLASLLDIVALGTVADVVKLDDNNRTLIYQGLRRIRAGRLHVGLAALFTAAGRDYHLASEYDLGFVIGPRLNAAGRLDDMSLGIECLITDDEHLAISLANRLDALNRDRRDVERTMQDSALTILDNVEPQEKCSLCLFDPEWHQGVIGILASRLKDKFHRPVLAFARGQDGELKGSGRSIRGLHLRDALDLCAKRHPGLVRKFGGHAMAAGLTLLEKDFEKFQAAWEATARTLLSPCDLQALIELDGSLAEEELTFKLADDLSQNIWGQGFPAPLFVDEFEVVEQRVVGDHHLKLKVKKFGKVYNAMLFSTVDNIADRVQAVYRLNVNNFAGGRSLQLTIEHWQAV